MQASIYPRRSVAINRLDRTPLVALEAPTNTRPLLAVVGNARLAEDDTRYEMAGEVRPLAIDAGFRIVTGLGGVMEAACHRAHESEKHREGDTIGLPPGFDPAEANRWVDIPIATGLDHHRNGLVANVDVVVALGGGAGTLSEMCFAWMRKRPFIALAVEGWSGEVAGWAFDERGRTTVRAAVSAQDAVQLAVATAQALGQRHRGIPPGH